MAFAGKGLVRHIEGNYGAAVAAKAKVELKEPTLILVPEIVRPVNRYGRDGCDYLKPYRSVEELAFGIPAEDVSGIDWKPRTPADEDHGVFTIQLIQYFRLLSQIVGRSHRRSDVAFIA